MVMRPRKRQRSSVLVFIFPIAQVSTFRCSPLPSHALHSAETTQATGQAPCRSSPRFARRCFDVHPYLPNGGAIQF